MTSAPVSTISGEFRQTGDQAAAMASPKGTSDRAQPAVRSPKAFRVLDLLTTFLAVFVPLATVLGALVVLVNDSIRQDTIDDILAAEAVRIAAARDQITRDFAIVTSDLLLLAGSEAVRAHIETGSEADRRAVERQFALFSGERGIYDQIRLLDATGQETVRVDFVHGAVRTVPAEELQNKSDRYYFSDAVRLPRGAVYVSPFDLNIERGQIERPLKPMIRFATPLIDETGTTRGVLVLNYYGVTLLDNLRTAMQGTIGQGMLLNAAGYWLYGPNPADEWAFMFGRERSFAVDHPALWQAMGRHEAGQIVDPAGLVTHAAIHPIIETLNAVARNHPHRIVAGVEPNPRDETWMVLTFVPQPTLNAVIDRAQGRFSLAFASAGAIILILSVLMSWGRLTERRSRDRLRLAAKVMEVTRDGVIILQPDHSILSVNGAFGVLFGFDPAEVTGRNCMALLCPSETPETLAAIWREVVRSGHWAGEVRHRCKDGRALASWTTISAIRNGDAAIANHVVIISDISDRKQVEEACFAAEAANRAKSHFLTMMSHELRTPLNAILGFSEMMTGPIGTRMTDRCAEYSGYIHESGTHLLDLINDILDISKIEAGKVEISPMRLECGEVLAGCLRLAAGRAEDAGLTLGLDMPEPVPPLFADERAIKQIMFNLLSNAVKFTPGGSVTVRARAVPNGGAAGDAVAISVSDTGIGIPPDQIERIQRPFERIDNRYSQSAGGTGLGLALVRGLVELHGGRLDIASTVGQGTTVTVTFPAEPATAAGLALPARYRGKAPIDRSHS